MKRYILCVCVVDCTVNTRSSYCSVCAERRGGIHFYIHLLFSLLLSFLLETTLNYYFERLYKNNVHFLTFLTKCFWPPGLQLPLYDSIYSFVCAWFEGRWRANWTEPGRARGSRSSRLIRHWSSSRNRWSSALRRPTLIWNFRSETQYTHTVHTQKQVDTMRWVTCIYMHAVLS